MIQRIRQFVRAMTARIRPEDRAFIDRSIPRSARPLFYAMHPADQCHVLYVAWTALDLFEDSLAAGKVREEDRALLLRCALLHDVGRVQGDLNVWGKVFCVLMGKIACTQARQLAKCNGNTAFAKLRHALYVYFHHADIGAAKLCAIGLHEEAAIIAKHHQAPDADDSPILCLLREADERN